MISSRIFPGLLSILSLAILAACSPGPVGIFQGIELEEKVNPLDVGLSIKNVQSLSTGGTSSTNAVASGGQIYLRESQSVTSKWKQIGLPDGYTASLDAALNAAGTTLYSIVYNNSETAFYSRPTSLSTGWVNDSDLDGAQRILSDNDSLLYVIVRDGNGNYDIHEDDGDQWGTYSASTAVPIGMFTDGTNTFAITSDSVLNNAGTDQAISLFDGRSVTGTGVYNITATDYLILGTDDGQVYISNAPGTDNTWALLAEVDSGSDSKQVRFTNSIEYDNKIFIGTQEHGYYVLSTISYTAGTPASASANIQRATAHSLSNLLDTKIWNGAIKGFATGPTPTSLYLYTANQGVWIGQEEDGKFEWRPLVSEE